MRTYIPVKLSALYGCLKVALVTVLHSFSKSKLPPGNLANLYTREITDQRYLLKQFQSHGPIVRTRMGKFLTISVLGLKLCRKLLLDREENLLPVSFDIKPLVGDGFMREMRGETHKKYRTILMKALIPNTMESDREFHRSIIEIALQTYASSAHSTARPETFIQTLDTIGQSIMLHHFFGARMGTRYHEEITAHYREMWDKQWHFYMEKRQLAAYGKLTAVMERQLDGDGGDAHNDITESILGRIHEAGSLDKTMFANLVYMVEASRLAVYSLMRWATKYAVDHPQPFGRIATDANVYSNEQVCFAQAFVLETLRLNQTERLLRHVTRSFEFEGFLFPKGSIARLSLWESHKSEDIFPDPFTFNPQRFLDNRFSLDEYAPFGLGSHRCPFGSLSIQICRLFLHTLANHFELEGINNGPLSRGIAHYEPAKAFTVRLHSKTRLV